MSTISVSSNHEVFVDCAFCPNRCSRKKIRQDGDRRICCVCDLYVCKDCNLIEVCDLCKNIYCNHCSAMLTIKKKRTCFRCQEELENAKKVSCATCSKKTNKTEECCACEHYNCKTCLSTKCQSCTSAFCPRCVVRGAICAACAEKRRSICSKCCRSHQGRSSRR